MTSDFNFLLVIFYDFLKTEWNNSFFHMGICDTYMQRNKSCKVVTKLNDEMYLCNGRLTS